MTALRRVLGTASAAAATTAVVASGGTTCFAPHTSTAPPYSQAEIDELRTYFRRNLDLNGTGAVVAAPDTVTGPGGDYYFHWERDGALSMDALLSTWPLEEANPMMRHYATRVHRLHQTPDSHGISVLVEPKFHIRDSEAEASSAAEKGAVAVYGGEWCRPQNDAAGLRARTLLHYAERLLDAGEEGYVRDHLWTGDATRSNGGLIKTDLEWVAENWATAKGCDLWEDDPETTAEYFWIQYTMRYAMHRGAEFAARMGDNATPARYKAIEEAMTLAVHKYWNGEYVYECDHRKKDAAVVEAFLIGDLEDGLFAPLSEEVLKTVITLSTDFCAEYDINHKDTANGIPGILWGRYPGDTYNGGNPWVLLSASLASLMYRQAAAAAALPAISDTTYDLLMKAYPIPAGLKGKALGDALMGAADGILLRLKHHAYLATPERTTRPEHTGGMHMAEQIERRTGQMTSAEDLTWNYANLLKALRERDLYVASVAEPSTPNGGRRLSLRGVPSAGSKPALERSTRFV